MSNACFAVFLSSARRRAAGEDERRSGEGAGYRGGRADGFAQGAGRGRGRKPARRRRPLRPESRAARRDGRAVASPPAHRSAPLPSPASRSAGTEAQGAEPRGFAQRNAEEGLRGGRAALFPSLHDKRLSLPSRCERVGARGRSSALGYRAVKERVRTAQRGRKADEEGDAGVNPRARRSEPSGPPRGPIRSDADSAARND